MDVFTPIHQQFLTQTTHQLIFKPSITFDGSSMTLNNYRPFRSCKTAGRSWIWTLDLSIIPSSKPAKPDSQSYIVLTITSVAANGIMSTMLNWMSTSLTNLYPSLTGFSYQASSTLPEKSLLLNIYQDSNKAETRYLPVQALQNCFRLELQH